MEFKENDVGLRETFARCNAAEHGGIASFLGKIVDANIAGLGLGRIRHRCINIE